MKLDMQIASVFYDSSSQLEKKTLKFKLKQLITDLKQEKMSPIVILTDFQKKQYQILSSKHAIANNYFLLNLQRQDIGFLVKQNYFDSLKIKTLKIDCGNDSNKKASFILLDDRFLIVIKSLEGCNNQMQKQFLEEAQQKIQKLFIKKSKTPIDILYFLYNNKDQKEETFNNAGLKLLNKKISNTIADNLLGKKYFDNGNHDRLYFQGETQIKFDIKKIELDPYKIEKNSVKKSSSAQKNDRVESMKKAKGKKAEKKDENPENEKPKIEPVSKYDKFVKLQDEEKKNKIIEITNKQINVFVSPKVMQLVSIEI